MSIDAVSPPRDARAEPPGPREVVPIEGLARELGPRFAATSHASVSAVLRDGCSFSSAGYAKTIGTVLGPSILAMDEPEHGYYRGFIQDAFGRGSVARWESEIVEPVVHRLVDAVADRGHAELVSELTLPLPILVVAGILGLPATDIPRFHAWTVDLLGVGAAQGRALQASRALAEYLSPLIQARRREPGSDLISVLAAETEGRRLDDEHVLGFLRLLLPAGAETTFRATTSLLTGLLGHPDQLDALRRDRALMPRALEEALRWRAPVASIWRTCVRDTDVAGTDIPAGAQVHLLLGEANHDAARYADPAAFDILRPMKRNLAFAQGPHRCLGAHLALAEMRIAAGAVLDRLPGVRLDPAADEVRAAVRTGRAPRTLPVLFDA